MQRFSEIKSVTGSHLVDIISLAEAKWITWSKLFAQFLAQFHIFSFSFNCSHRGLLTAQHGQSEQNSAAGASRKNNLREHSLVPFLLTFISIYLSIHHASTYLPISLLALIETLSIHCSFCHFCHF